MNNIEMRLEKKIINMSHYQRRGEYSNGTFLEDIIEKLVNDKLNNNTNEQKSILENMMELKRGYMKIKFRSDVMNKKKIDNYIYATSIEELFLNKVKKLEKKVEELEIENKEYKEKINELSEELVIMKKR